MPGASSTRNHGKKGKNSIPDSMPIYSEMYPYDEVAPLYDELQSKIDALSKHDPAVGGIAGLMFEIQQKTIDNLASKQKLITDSLEEKISTLQSENFIAESRVTLLETKVCHLEKELLDMKEYSMSNDIVFQGIAETVPRDRDNPEQLLRKFWREELNLADADSILIDDVHRLGKPTADGKPRAIICKFVQRLSKKKVLGQGKALTGKTQYSMWEHIPPAAKESRKELYDERKARKDRGEEKVYVRGARLIVNSVCVKDMSKIKAKKVPKNEAINGSASKLLTHLKDVDIKVKDVESSRFKAMFLPLANPSDVQPALVAMRAHAQTNGATHNIWASSIDGKTDHDDDNEYSAGRRLLKVLKESKKEGVVLVARYYGGKDIGEKRFHAVCDLGREAIGVEPETSDNVD